MQWSDFKPQTDLNETKHVDVIMIMEAKLRPGQESKSLLTVEHFEQMIALEDFIYSIKLPLHDAEQECRNETGFVVPCEPRMLGLGDLCRREHITSAADEAKWE